MKANQGGCLICAGDHVTTEHPTSNQKSSPNRSHTTTDANSSNELVEQVREWGETAGRLTAEVERLTAERDAMEEAQMRRQITWNAERDRLRDELRVEKLAHKVTCDIESRLRAALERIVRVSESQIPPPGEYLTWPRIAKQALAGAADETKGSR